MRLSLTLYYISCLSIISAQSSSSSATSPSTTGSSDSQGYLPTVVQALTAANLTSLVNIASIIANTSEGQAFLSQLPGSNKTVFAPSNDALSQIPADTLADPLTLTQILAYHIANTTILPDGIAISPNHSIGRSLLNGGRFALPGNRTAPCVCQRQSAGSQSIQVVQATSNANSSTTGTDVGNLRIYVIDTVLQLPPSFSSAADLLFPAVANIARPLGLVDLIGGSRGVTVFVPTDAALAAAGGGLGSLNTSQISALLDNHIINGSVAYSDRFWSTNYTSAAGQRFRFTQNSTGTFVQSANATARVVQSDIITDNGVVHLIDNVLLNVQDDPGAASSAYASASSAATLPETWGTGVMSMTSTSQPAASGASASASAAASSRSSAWATGGLDASLWILWLTMVIGGVSIGGFLAIW